MTSTDIDAAPATAPAADPEALLERIFTAGLAAMDLIAVYLGDRLGLYRLLAEAPRTAAELAAAAGADERYLREWLEQQAVTGILAVDDPDAGPAERRFQLPAGHHAGFLDPDSPFHLAPPMARAVVAVSRQMPALLRAFRSGEGVPYEAYGPDMREAIEAFNRPAFVNLLCAEWLPAMPDIDDRLRAPGARVAELACGSGRAAIALALGYPGLRVDGFDLDEASIDRARANAAEAGVGDRVSFAVRDASTSPSGGGYDLVCVFEALHDMARPVEALAAARALAAPDGHVLVVDERAGERFTAPGDDLERFLYGSSVAFCLPTARTERPSAATGTVMRPSTLAAYARDAGFARVEEAPIDYPFWRFHRLHAA
ncbi:MAG TPA: class I SAM-dependent methyltransferase [Miltoncostaeaceae bacterium]|jgi:SAM-dependent methyltransferase|nr:class I SAM-dependent methyltransferase [Miltoncostaeaceae bacterium]